MNRSDKKLKTLYRYLDMQVKIFQDTYELLSENGMWTLSKNMKARCVRRYPKYIPLVENMLPAENGLIKIN
jgi:hypothetical protein